MAGRLYDFSDLWIGKPPLWPLSVRDTVADALAALKRIDDTSTSSLLHPKTTTSTSIRRPHPPFPTLCRDSYTAQLYPLIKLPRDKCSLLPHRHFWISSKRIVTPQGIISGSVEINDGKIISVVKGHANLGKPKQEEVIDYGDAVIMPGLIDVHVHLDEPGRTEWEGFDTGTRAAAAGGVTTVVDMPLNNYPTTVSKEKLKLKLDAAEDKIYVDVGFWGGLIPENALNTSILEGLLSAGVLGVKSFMCPSGINDFPMTTIDHIKAGLSVLAKYRRPIVVHAEIQKDFENHLELNEDNLDPRAYLTYLNSRPPSWEEAAIKQLVGVAKDTRKGGPLEGVHIHIVHLSDSSASLDLIKEGHIDLLSTDHSPTVPKLKLVEEADFLKAWGGISSLQFNLPVTWSYGKKYGLTLEQLSLLWSKKPATLAGLESKGTIAVGNHEDIVVWQPELEFDLDDDYPVFIKHLSSLLTWEEGYLEKFWRLLLEETLCLRMGSMLLHRVVFKF